MVEQIDFSKLKPYRSDKKKSFELLCYHIAKREHEGLGAFTPVDDSGGGDGVEFYLTLPNNEVWGWQAKFFLDTDRLSHGGREKQIISSLEKACSVHPNLTKWILCTPSKFTPKEQTWFKNELPTNIPASFTTKLDITHWNSDFFTACFSNSKFSGIASFFFGSLELTNEWFAHRFQENFKIVESKYDSDVHSKNAQVSRDLDKALINENYIDLEWTHFKTRLHTKESAYNELTRNFKQMNNLDAADESRRSEFLIGHEQFSNILKDLWEDIGHLNRLLEEKDVSALNDFQVIEKFEKNELFIRNLTEPIVNQETKIADKLNNLKEEIWNIYWQIHDFFSFNFDFNKKEFKIVGDANSGKTHIVCDLCKSLIDNSLPAIFIPAFRFSNKTSIETALKEILDIPVQYSFDDFLNSLDVAAEVSGSRIPIFLEGLNETTINLKGFSDIWKNNITPFTEKILKRKNLLLITTCRPGYFEEIWGKTVYADYTIHGFSDTEDAIYKYFEKYKIKADINFSSLEHFRKPIYLKLFCEIKNPKAKKTEHTEVIIGEENLTEVFDSYLASLDAEIIHKYQLKKGRKIIKPSLLKIAKYLWENNERSMPIEEFYKIIDQETISSDHSLSSILLNEGLLFISDWDLNHETIRFTYDPLAGFLIAESLISENLEDKNTTLYKVRVKIFQLATNLKIDPYGKFALLISSKIKRFVNSETSIESLFNFDYRKLHPLSQDISVFFTLLLPRKEGRHLYQLTNNRTAFDLSVSSFFELPVEFIRSDEIELVSDLLSKSENIRYLLDVSQKTIPITNHPFNVKYWSAYFKSQTMAQRDLSWTEFIRENSNVIENYINQFELSCKYDLRPSDLTIKRNHLIAEYLMWTLTSTNRYLRNLATRALYYYSIRFPPEFLMLVETSFTINDPYVSERTIAALYGSVLANEYSFINKDFLNTQLFKIAKTIYEIIFSEGAVHSTTHILTRDYARRIIELAIKYNPNLFSTKEVERARPPYKDGGIRNWETGTDEFTGQMFGGPIRMDFGNYTIGYIVADGHGYVNSPEKIKVRGQIYWRIYNLGYNVELFKEAENNIGNSNYSYSRGEKPKVERYGKKYSWIAFFEMAGYRDDHGLLKNDWEEPRISSVDIDPTFPEVISSHSIIQEDYLGDRNQDIAEWLKADNNPNYNKYLKIKQLYGAPGEWVCLNGYINQEDKEADRCRSAYFRSILVNENEHASIYELLIQKKMRGKPLPDIRTNYHTFFNELISFPEMAHDNWADLEFVTETQKVIVKKGDPDYYPDFGFFDDDGSINITPKYPAEREIERRITENFEILLPVMGYQSEKDVGLNNSYGVEIVSAEIIKHLDLISQESSLNLYDRHGKTASITFKIGGDYKNSEHFIFIRKDLLEQYLSDKKLKLIWVVWGEKLLANYDFPTHEIFRKKYGFDSIQEYNEIIPYESVEFNTI